MTFTLLNPERKVLSILLQACSPVVLQLECLDGQKEAVLLRSLIENALDMVIDLCEVGNGDVVADQAICVIRDPVSSLGARGLFLLAYQGLDLGQGQEWGGGVADRVRRLMQLALPQWPWAWPQVKVDGLTGKDGRVEAQKRPVGGEGVNKIRVKVGFASAFFSRHSVGRLLARVIMALDREKFDVRVLDLSRTLGDASFGVNNNAGKSDDLTRAIKASVSPACWHALPQDPPSAANLVRALSLDVLVWGDLYMDASASFLSMLRLAPVSVAFWGHPFTSGHDQCRRAGQRCAGGGDVAGGPAVDYFVSSRYFEPSDYIGREQR